jgi:hypothetical protein
MPGPDVRQQTQTSPGAPSSGAPATGSTRAKSLTSLTDDQRRLVGLLQTRPEGMTLRQLQLGLMQPNAEVQSMLDNLQQRQLVARLNTLVPSYTYRYGGLDLNAD